MMVKCDDVHSFTTNNNNKKQQEIFNEDVLKKIHEV